MCGMTGWRTEVAGRKLYAQQDRYGDERVAGEKGGKRAGGTWWGLRPFLAVHAGAARRPGSLCIMSGWPGARAEHGM